MRGGHIIAERTKQVEWRIKDREGSFSGKPQQPFDSLNIVFARSHHLIFFVDVVVDFDHFLFDAVFVDEVDVELFGVGRELVEVVGDTFRLRNNLRNVEMIWILIWFVIWKHIWIKSIKLLT